MKNALAELEAISRYAGNRVDYVQGGGGNTSVKLDDHRMLVKSSGSALGELCESSGFVMVDYQSIANEIANAESNELASIHPQVRTQRLPPVRPPVDRSGLSCGSGPLRTAHPFRLRQCPELHG